MQVELTSTTTSDGIKLHGIILEPETPRTDLTIDCMMMVHGSGANFYASPSNPRAEKFRDMGIPVALFNMRGHDVIAGHSGGHQVGNVWELLSETHLDQLAILDLLEERGYHKIGLMGSSLGAVRVVIGSSHHDYQRHSVPLWGGAPASTPPSLSRDAWQTSAPCRTRVGLEG